MLDLQKIITPVDARKLADERYTSNTTFNQQIATADVVIGNKQDLYRPADETARIAYAREQADSAVSVIWQYRGRFPLNS